VDCDYIGWNSSEIISRLISLGCSLSADASVMDLLQREHHEIFAGIWVGYRKKWPSAYKSSSDV